MTVARLMEVSMRRPLFFLLASLAWALRSQACAVVAEIPPVPLPSIAAPKPVEAYLRPLLPPPSVRRPPDVSIAFTCGGGFAVGESVALGLIELFGSAPYFATAVAARRVDVAELRPRTDSFQPAVQKTGATKLPVAEAALLHDWLTTDASYLWGEELIERPPFARGVRVTFCHAGKFVTLDLHFTEQGVVAGSTHGVGLVKLAPIPDDVEALLSSLGR
jgi:hypothetical protein